LNPSDFDLLEGLGQGGCSAKLPAQLLERVIRDIPRLEDPRLLVGTSTSDDAAIWKLDATTALIHTTDFFPPVCSDPETFGRIAASNALSDVFAMGGRPLTALNLVMFPSSRWPIEVLQAVLKGGAEVMMEAGAVLAGGHTIDDDPIKYGLAVTGIVHPDRIATNCCARPGEVLVLTKAIGTGVLMAGHRLGEVKEAWYRQALDSMIQLNRAGAECLQKYHLRCATDVTGFSLLGHGLEMAVGSGVTLAIDAGTVPLLEGTLELLEMGCIPGAAFRNLRHVESRAEFLPGLDYALKMALLDAQTSGGLLISCPIEKVEGLLNDLKAGGHLCSAVIGEVLESGKWPIVVRPGGRLG